ncbi:type II toxin-antitoxin system RelE/ParE family toxin [Aliamphritea hakodatensis]|uniref:type II toxin-antitoxin system RelE/ParE family toxin n=1 Tax=Aliamphritea hakodatensis TaxID=2895352 RepID=UPI0022FD38FC|nr:type II toxin-antitoxin system RelE/ParE family toxin [Aliamphritea hakodatensis]
MTRIFLTKKFTKWSDAIGLADDRIKDTIAEIENGLIDADLGGSIFKKRTGINERGNSGSLRTIIGFKKGNKAFFLYGFLKSETDNITQQEKAAFKEMAKVYFQAQ